MFSKRKPSDSRIIVRAVAVAVVACAVGASALPAGAASNDVTISNGGLSVTFNLSWGAVVTQHVCIYRHAVNYIGRG